MGTLTITAKVKLDLDNHQTVLLQDTITAFRDACNHLSKYAHEHHESNQYALHNACYYDIRNTFGLKAQMTQSVIRIVAARYNSALTNQHKDTGKGEWVKSCITFTKSDVQFVYGKDYRMTSNGTIRLSTPYGLLDCMMQGRDGMFDGSVKLGTATLYRSHHKYYLLIPMTMEVPDNPELIYQQIVGIDRGIRFVMCTYDLDGHTVFVSGRQIKRIRAKYKALRSSLQTRKTRSSRRRLKAIGSREHRWISDINHCISKALVESNPANTLYVLENLSGIRSALTKVKHNNRYLMVSWPYYDLQSKIEYKAKRRGGDVIYVNPKYTSQTCPRCGYRNKWNRNQYIHTFICKACGYHTNDDRAAAMNILAKGKRELAKMRKAQMANQASTGETTDSK